VLVPLAGFLAAEPLVGASVVIIALFVALTEVKTRRLRARLQNEQPLAAA
jgi:hypothetical protein